MVAKLLLIAAVSAGVFWLVGRYWPGIRASLRGRVLPLLASPVAFMLLRRLFWLLLRLLLFRR